VVQSGDSLWALAEQDLARRSEPTTDAAVARAWPTWWSANRDAVGDDPDLLHPGTRLTAPADDSTPASS
jgi:nucleoid-associated protein YgaU